MANEAGLEIADWVREKLLAAFDRLARHPGIGHKREDLTPLTVRFYAVYQYLVIYSHDSKALWILSVIHGKRDVAALMAERFRSDRR